MSASDIKTDDSKLVTTDTVYVSPDGGTTDEAFPKPNVEYDFCVRFNLSGGQDPPLDLDFTQDDGLDAAATVKAVVHFGRFPNEFIDYHLEACIYAKSAPEKPINCAGSFDFPINTESTSDSGSGGSDESSASTETADSDTDSTTTE